MDRERPDNQGPQGQPAAAVEELSSHRRARWKLALPLIAVALLAAVGLVGFGLVHDAPSEPASGSPLPVGELADSPPPAVETWFAQGPEGSRLRPLTDSELATVRVTAATARRVALASRGFGYGPNGNLVVWTTVECVSLGYYTAPFEPSVGYVPTAFPAYVVQVFAAPVPGFPEAYRALIVVDAETGQVTDTYGDDAGAFATTCGVSP